MKFTISLDMPNSFRLNMKGWAKMLGNYGKKSKELSQYQNSMSNALGGTKNVIDHDYL